ncbi:angiogenic factor with G patch and FHA domains 1 isoform X2 [Bicyclus anynana]|uniref:Angiogenic factor with G patch and FHA domains 1 isoform X2 n=1 Tax=Bicyclus anynana TaxID=110368 RepID=A0A6J1P926_BICAN|nr:angiogenic factor with G patch and FHA domains 1 isoform X2 [Bicyclus anynana]
MEMDKPACITTSVESQRNRKRFSIRSLRLSLKFRPEILKLVLKMRHTIRIKNALLSKLKRQLKNNKVSIYKSSAEDVNPPQRNPRTDLQKEDTVSKICDKNNSYTQTSLEDFKNFNFSNRKEKQIKDSYTQISLEEFRDTNGTEKVTKDSFTQMILEEFKDFNLTNEKEKGTKDSYTQMTLEFKDFNLTNEKEKETKDSYTETTHEEFKDFTNEIENHTKDTQTDNLTNEKEKDTKDSYTETTHGELKNFINEKENDTKETQTDNLHTTEDKTNNNSDKVSTAWGVQSDGDNIKSIADQVKEVAQSALQQSGMVYVETAGMYYDYKTGYYYNSELGLYYHTDTGCYYYYSDEKQSFVFHSYPENRTNIKSSISKEIKKATKQKKENDDGETKPKRRKKGEEKDKIKTTKKIQEETSKEGQEEPSKEEGLEEKMECSSNEKTIDEDKEGNEVENDINKELEDGECSDTASETSDGAISDASTSTASDDETVAKHYPPCMRIIVRETTLPKLKVGSLYLITKDGGTIGREGDHHDILLKDNNVSRNHLELKYDIDKRLYFAVDLGSKNGTLLNGTRMSESQQTSVPMEVVHGSTIKLGETKLLCHVHAGHDTCGHCEPGLIMEMEEKEKKVAYTRTCSVQKQHKLELARLKNKYAPKRLAIEETAYNDRAQARREKVGSTHHAEKTQTSDINTFIAPDNKGFKLLEKMGWSKGEGLGKDNQGNQEPIPLVSNEGKTGLGGTSVPQVVVFKTLGQATLRLAAATKMQPPAKAFLEVDEDSE